MTHSGLGCGDLVVAFAATVTGGKPRPSDERDAVRFFSADELPPGTSDKDRARICDALARHKKAVLCVQPSDGTEPPPGSR